MRTTSNQSRHDEREPRTDISQVELQLHGLRDALRRRREVRQGAPNPAAKSACYSKQPSARRFCDRRMPGKLNPAAAMRSRA
jgi:hypothetical protein